MTARISRRLLAHTIGTRLIAVTNATGYVGQVGAMNGLPGVSVTPGDPPAKGPKDPRVKPYFVLFPGIGTNGTEDDLGDTLIDLDWPFTITAAAGDVDDLLDLADRIETLLYRWRPGVLATDDGPVLTGPVRHPVGAIPPLLLDRAVTPPRHTTQLEYQLTAHT